MRTTLTIEDTCHLVTYYVIPTFCIPIWSLDTATAQARYLIQSTIQVTISTT